MDKPTLKVSLIMEQGGRTREVKGFTTETVGRAYAKACTEYSQKFKHHESDYDTHIRKFRRLFDKIEPKMRDRNLAELSEREGDTVYRVRAYRDSGYRPQEIAE